MPTYSYSCKKCGAHFDVFQKITEDPVKKCQECGQETAHRGIGGGLATFQFKGSGYYCTDYPKESPKEKNKSCDCNKKNCC